MRNKIVMALLGAVVLAGSCDTHGLDQQALDVKGIITLEKGKDYELSHLGETIQLSYTSGDSWTIDGLDEDTKKWLEVTPEKGSAGTTVIKVNAKANADADREAPLQIKNGSNTIADFVITQEKIVFKLTNEEVLRDNFRWNDFKRDGDKSGVKTLKLSSNIGWRLEFDGKDYEWCQFDKTEKKDELSFVNLRTDEINIIPAARNVDATRTLKAFLVPLKSDGSDLGVSGIKPLELNLTQDFLIFRTEWDGMTTSGVKELGPLPYDVAPESARDACKASFTVLSELNWNVDQYPSWLELYTDEACTQKLSGTIQADKEKPKTVWVKTKYANPRVAARTNKDDINIVLRPIDEKDAKDDTLDLPVNQQPFVFNLQYNGKAVPATSALEVNPFSSGEYSRKESFSISASGTVDSSWLSKDHGDWLACAVGSDGGSLTFGIADGKQQLEFKPETTTVTVRPPRTWFDPKETDGIGMQRQLKFTQNAFVFDLEGWGEDSYLNNIGNKSKKKTPIKVTCTGEWSLSVSEDWVADENGVLKDKTYSAGPTTIQLGSNSSNPYDADRHATVTFVSKTHEAANRLDITGAKFTKTITQKEYQLMIIEKETSPELASLGIVPAYDPDGLKLFLVCSGAWEMTQCPEFLHTEKMSETNDDDEFEGTIRFDVITNTAATGIKSQYIEITPKANVTPLRISVSQDRFVFDVNPQTGQVPAYSASKVSAGQVTFTPKVKWELRHEGQAVEGFGNKVATGKAEQLNLTLPTNLDGQGRTLQYELVVTEPGGVSSVPIPLNQEGFLFNFGTHDLFFNEIGKQTQEWPILCSGPWVVQQHVSAADNWFHAKPVEDGKKIQAYADNNYWTGSGGRQNVFVIESTLHKQAGQTLEWQVNVSQKPFIWQVTNPYSDGQFSYYFGPLPLSSDIINLNVKSSGGWSVKNSDHLTVVKNSESVTLTPTKNLSTTDSRNYTVSIESEFVRENAALKQELTITQGKFIWEVNKSELSWDSALATEAQTFTVSCSGEWKLLSKSGNSISSGDTVDGWRFEWNDAEGDTEVSVAPLKNDSFEAKNPKLTIVSIEHEKASENNDYSLQLNQPAYALNFEAGKEIQSFTAWNTGDENSAQSSDKITVNSSGEFEIKMDPNNPWVYLAAKEQNSITLKVENNTGAERTAKLTLCSKEEGITLVSPVQLTVRQEGFVLKTKAQSDENLAFDVNEGAKDVAIDCSASWGIKSIDQYGANFVTANKKEDNKTLHIEVTKNTTKGERKADIVLESHGVEYTVKLVQAAN